MNDDPTIAGEQSADESGDYGFLAYQIASAALAQIRSMMEEAQLTLNLLRSLVNMTVLPEGELLVDGDRSILQLPEAPPPSANPFFITNQIKVQAIATLTELQGLLVGFYQYCPLSNPPKMYLAYSVSGSGTEPAAGVGNPSVTWTATGPAFTCDVTTGVISSAAAQDAYGVQTSGLGLTYGRLFTPNEGGSAACSPAPGWTSAYHGTFTGTISSGTQWTVSGASVSYTVNLTTEDTDQNAVTYTATRNSSTFYNPGYTVIGDDTNNYGFNASAGPGSGLLSTNYEDRTNDGSWTYANGGIAFWYQFGVYYLHFTDLPATGRIINWTVVWEYQSANGDGAVGNQTGYGTVWTTGRTDTGSFVTSGSTTNDTTAIACPGPTSTTVDPTTIGKRWRIQSISYTVS